ncbi:putative transcription factor tos4 [Phaeomoniella chlamydospora]|uniref:Putative transcription factor tos4 n=1 Tax=Phaeomoniella chlamydospora TaxID=158046 RepID=A0A0G2GWU2_PHACM|nr:putative transcription factor tos4 [Phaeomoniella chlamydospora]
MSPLRQRQRIASPVSPSPAVQAALAPSSPLLLPPPSSPPPVEIYEDEEAEEDVIARPDNGATQQSTQVLTQPFGQTDSNSQLPPSSETKEHFLQQSPLIDPPEELSDHDEENDPIVHSFGPFGANLLGSMQAFKTYDSPRSEPPAPRSPITSLKQSTASPTQSTIKADFTQIQSHIINQLAFSRLSSTPLSTIIANLPHGETYKRSDIKDLINETKCIGEIQREGKDAAGKPLESEYYYVADKDDDEMRKGAVVHDLGRTGLRNCRKQHKQYYWRKPKAK